MLTSFSSDSLQRHLARHGDVFKPTPSGRSKRACISCRAGKIKCDGNDRCATCVKRGVECKYRQEDQPVTTESQRRTESPNPAPSEVMEVDQLSLTSAPVIAPESTSVSRNTVVSPSNPLSEESAQGRKVSEAFKLPGPTGLVDCMYPAFIFHCPFFLSLLSTNLLLLLIETLIKHSLTTTSPRVCREDPP